MSPKERDEEMLAVLRRHHPWSVVFPDTPDKRRTLDRVSRFVRFTSDGGFIEAWIIVREGVDPKTGEPTRKRGG